MAKKCARVILIELKTRWKNTKTQYSQSVWWEKVGNSRAQYRNRNHVNYVVCSLSFLLSLSQSTLDFPAFRPFFSTNNCCAMHSARQIHIINARLFDENVKLNFIRACIEQKMLHLACWKITFLWHSSSCHRSASFGKSSDAHQPTYTYLHSRSVGRFASQRMCWRTCWLGITRRSVW